MVDDSIHGRPGSRPGDLPHEERYGGMPHDFHEPHGMSGDIPRAGRTPAAGGPGGLPPASQGMGYASPRGYESPVAPGPTPEARQAVREYESRGPAGGMGGAPAARPQEWMGEHPRGHAGRLPMPRTKSSSGDVLRVGALVLGAVGALLLVVWLIATLSLQLSWPANLFMTGLIFLGIAAGVLWAAKRAPGGGVMGPGGA